ncbi:FecR domain-containing protein [Candidatus Pelagibacter sp.]|nr:FecR domain-containing protein [Candidatus Pelagibacter sp.]
MKVNHKKLTLKCFIVFIKIILLLSLTSLSFANEKKIGSVTEISGTIVAITDDLEERDLLIHDPVFLNEEIFITQGSSATIQFNDSTAIIMKELTSLNVSVFENSKLKPKIKAKLLKGQIIIESGSIAKNKSGEMVIDVATSTLGLRGTRIDVNLKPDGKSDISLAEDSFGNVGEIEVYSGGQSTNMTSVDQVLTVSENNEVGEREKTDEEKNNAKTVSETLTQSSKIDEDEIIQQLEKKLADGNLEDANNDGIINEDDVEIAKEIITEEKILKIDFIVENSENDNSEFLSNVINQSDEKNTGDVLEKIIDTQNGLVEGIVNSLSDKDNKFLTTTNSKGGGLIRERIFETIVSNETNNSAAILSKVMAKSDDATISSVINIITLKNENTNSKLSLKVMADFSEKNPEKLEIYSKTNKTELQQLTVSAVEEAQSTQEDADLISKIVKNVNEEIVNNVISEVTKNSNNKKQSLSAKVMKSIVLTNPDNMKNLSDENKDIMISQTIEAAKNQEEGITTDELDLTNTIAEIITGADNETASNLLQVIDDIIQNDDSKLSLNIVNNLTKQENYEEKLEILSISSSTTENNITKLIEKSVDSASSKEEINLVKDIITNSKGTIADKMINTANANQESKKKITNIIVELIDKNPEKALEIISKNQNKTTTEEIKSKIENGDAISTDDFDDVFEDNVSPN